MVQKGFIFDVNKCTACSACQLACTIENQVSPQIVWRQVNTFNPRKYPGIPVFHHSLACNHCIDPPCMAYCPALAFSKNPVTGAVTIDEAKCIGCKYCSWSCPYDAPQYNMSAGVMEKCTFCAHRLDNDLEPACVTLCPTGALKLGEYTSTDTREAVMGFPLNGTEPAIEFVPLVKNRACPDAEITHDAQPGQARAHTLGLFEEPKNKVTLKSEWTLVVFTLMAAFLVGALTAGVLGAFFLRPLSFAVAGVVGMVLSTFHLGRWKRAPRAVLNWRRSWLSREVLLFPAFLLFGLWYFATSGEAWLSGWFALGIGFAALFSIDRVYSVTKKKGLEFHSAQVVLTGLLVASILTGIHGHLFTAMLLALKAVLYLARKVRVAREQRDPRWFLSICRLALGCGVPVLVWSAGWAGLATAVSGVVVLGELIDRCEYYVELDIQTPRAEMAREFVRQLPSSKKAG